MKFLLVAAALVAVAVAGPARFITPGGAGPAPIIDSPISVGPAFVGKPPISVGPAIVDDFESPAHVEHLYIDPPFYSSPLVQVIVNVNSGSPAAPAPVEEIVPTPVIVVEQPEKPEPVVVAPIEFPEIVPTPVIVVEQPEVPEPVIVAPIEIAPVITLPDELN